MHHHQPGRRGGGEEAAMEEEAEEIGPEIRSGGRGSLADRPRAGRGGAMEEVGSPRTGTGVPKP